MIMGLPLPRQKNLLNLAFSATKSPDRTLMQTSKTRLYALKNQWNTRRMLRINGPFLWFETLQTDFEFNTPILKNGGPNLNDFEKTSTDFERFAIFFEWILKSVSQPNHFVTCPISPTFASL